MAKEGKKKLKWLRSKKLKKQIGTGKSKEMHQLEVLYHIKEAYIKSAGIFQSSKIYRMEYKELKEAVTSARSDFGRAIEIMRRIEMEEDASVVEKLTGKKNRALRAAGIYDDSAVYGMRLDSLERYADKFRENMKRALECQKEIEKLEPIKERVESQSADCGTKNGGTGKAASDDVNCSCELCRKSSFVGGGGETESPPTKGPEFTIWSI
jgi:hypothetical protein